MIARRAQQQTIIGQDVVRVEHVGGGTARLHVNMSLIVRLKWAYPWTADTVHDDRHFDGTPLYAFVAVTTQQPKVVNVIYATRTIWRRTGESVSV